MKLNFLILLASAYAFTSACSVNSETVDNRPPVVHTDLVSFSTASGSFGLPNAQGEFGLQLTSVFLWPENLSEDQAAELVKSINGTSMKADPLFAKLSYILRDKNELQGEWDQTGCISKYADVPPDYDPEIDGGVKQWKVPPANDQKSISDIQLCIANQDRRSKVESQQNDLRVQLSPLLNEISKDIDPDQTRIVNAKTLDAPSSRLSFILGADGAVSVHVKLGGFLFSNYSPSTDVTDQATGLPQITNATYGPRLHLLSFDVPEVDGTKNADGSLHKTGLVYKFRVERAPNIGLIASFRGDMNLYNSAGQIIRYGTARIDGFPPK